MTELLLAPAPAATDIMTFADYQQAVEGAITYDDNGKTVLGQDPKLYFLGGIYEEYAETLEYDAPYPDYSRIGVLALNPSESNRYQADTEALHDHQKEFGDLLWYSTALLNKLSMPLNRALSRNGNVPDSIAAFDQTVQQNQRFIMPPAIPVVDEYVLSFRGFAQSAARLMETPGNRVIQDRVATQTRRLLGTVSWIAQNRLDSSLTEIAVINLEKISKRKATGTTFGSGDNRENLAA